MSEVTPIEGPRFMAVAVSCGLLLEDLGEDMKAVAVFPRSREVKVIEQEDPRISEPDQVRLRMLDIGICGTDKEICSFEYGTPPP